MPQQLQLKDSAQKDIVLIRTMCEDQIILGKCKSSNIGNGGTMFSLEVNIISKKQKQENRHQKDSNIWICISYAHDQHLVWTKEWRLHLTHEKCPQK